MEPDQVEEAEQESERLWKTPNTLDAEGLAAAADESRPEDVTGFAPEEVIPPPAVEE